MPRLYLLGGENVHKRSAREVNEKAFRDASEPLAVLVFPWARASFDNKYQERKILADYFISLGACTVDFVEYSTSREIISEKMSTSKLIYLTGGLVNALVERLEKSGTDVLLRNYGGVIVGRSAGALALCKKCLITSRRTQKTSVIKGLGLADLTLKAHYRPERDSILEVLSTSQRIYAVPSRSAIIYEDGIRGFIGNVYVFENGKKREL